MNLRCKKEHEHCTSFPKRDSEAEAARDLIAVGMVLMQQQFIVDGMVEREAADRAMTRLVYMLDLREKT